MIILFNHSAVRTQTNLSESCMSEFSFDFFFQTLFGI